MAKDYKTIFADNLIKFRGEKKITQSVLAEKTGLSETSISCYENGKKVPSIVSAQKMADVLGVTLDELLGNTPETQYKRELDNNGVLTILSALELLKAKVRVKGNTVELIFDPKNNCWNYSSANILDFFKEYAYVQNLAASSVTKETAEKYIESLKEKYKSLPDQPDYKR